MACNRNYEKKFDEDWANGFQNTLKFCGGTTNFV